MDNQNQTTEIVLAIDPGSAKFGYAIVDSKGEMLSKGVGKHEDFETIIATLIDANHITAIALGDGTNSDNFER